MARHEGQKPKGHKEHARKEAKRMHGGGLNEMKEEKEEAEGGKEHERKRGGHVPHKAGGKVEGKHAKARPDRQQRARGGATSDPLSAAGKMSKLPYESHNAGTDEGGKGPDRD